MLRTSVFFMLLVSASLSAQDWESYKKTHSFLLTLKVGAANKPRLVQLRLDELIEDGQANADGDTYNSLTSENFLRSGDTPELEKVATPAGVMQRVLDTGSEKYNYMVLAISEPYHKCFHVLCSADYTCLGVEVVRTPGIVEESDDVSAWQTSPYDEVKIDLNHKPKKYNKLQIALLAIGARAYLYYHKTCKGLAHLWRHLTFSRCSARK